MLPKNSKHFMGNLLVGDKDYFQNSDFLWIFNPTFSCYICIVTVKRINLILHKSNRSSCLEVFCKEVAFINFANFTGKHLCWNLIFNKIIGCRSAALLKRDSSPGAFQWFSRIKKRRRHRCFSVKFVKFFINVSFWSNYETF